MTLPKIYAVPANSIDGYLKASGALSGRYGLCTSWESRYVPFGKDGSYGDFEFSLTLPPIDAEGQICIVENWVVTGVDTTENDYEIGVHVVIYNAALTEVATLDGTATANSGIANDSVEMAAGSLSSTATEGTDIGYGDDDGSLDSTAGGTYSVVAWFYGTYI